MESPLKMLFNRTTNQSFLLRLGEDDARDGSWYCTDTLYLVAVEAVSPTTQQAWQWMKARRFSEFHGLHREVSSLS